jgi:hypothetical protein
MWFAKTTNVFKLDAYQAEEHKNAANKMGLA